MENVGGYNKFNIKFISEGNLTSFLLWKALGIITKYVENYRKITSRCREYEYLNRLLNLRGMNCLAWIQH